MDRPTAIIPESIIQRLILSRYFFWLAEDYARSEREVTSFSAINLLQDSTEYFLLAVAEKLEAAVKPHTKFEEYLTLIDDRLRPQSLPFRSKLLQLNRLRVNSKHHGIRPNTTELRGLIVVVREFLEEVSREVFDTNFWSVSLSDLLKDGDVKRHIQLAEQAFKQNSYVETLVECRKAFFYEFEWSYDIREFSDGEPDNFLAALMSRAPHWTKNKQYIAEKVMDPFDYIVLDHERIERDIAKHGIDHQAFWNIWRLTPRVYPPRTGGDWLVEHDLTIFEPAGIENRAAYVLDTTVDVLLTKHTKERSQRFVSSHTSYVVKVVRSGARVYKKADRRSMVTGIVPDDVTELTVKSSCPALDGDGRFWKVLHYHGDLTTMANTHVHSGYIHDEDVEAG
jgi:hypothetical protein